MRTTGGLRLMAITAIALLAAGCAATSPLARTLPGSMAKAPTMPRPKSGKASAPIPSTAPRRRPYPRPVPSRAGLASTVITAGDVPRAWIRHGRVTYDQKPAWPVSTLAGCLGVRNTDGALVTTVDSGNFDRDTADLLIRVASYRSQTAVASDSAAAFQPRFVPCYLRWARRYGITAPGAQILDVRAHLSHRTSTQPASVVANLEMSFVLRGHGTSDRIYSEEIWMRGRDTAATVDFINTDSRVPAKFQAQVVATVAGRLADL